MYDHQRRAMSPRLIETSLNAVESMSHHVSSSRTGSITTGVQKVTVLKTAGDHHSHGWHGKAPDKHTRWNCGLGQMQHLFIVLPKSEHNAALGVDAHSLGLTKHIQRLHVVGSRIPHPDLIPSKHPSHTRSGW